MQNGSVTPFPFEVDMTASAKAVYSDLYRKAERQKRLVIMPASTPYSSP
jgi:hypothetical protein